MWGDRMTIGRLQSAMPRNASVSKANTRFRRECVDKTFWSAEELDRHRAMNSVNRLEITFGFEAVAHALYACEYAPRHALDHPPALPWPSAHDNESTEMDSSPAQTG